jgi:hypothetical protein
VNNFEIETDAMTSSKINRALSRSMTRGGTMNQFENSMFDINNKKDRML